MATSYTFFESTTPTNISPPDAEYPFKSLSDEVKAILAKKGIINESRINPEVDWFFCNLGFEPHYFETNNADKICQHILSLYAAKIVSETSNSPPQIALNSESEDNAFFATHSMPGKSTSPVVQLEYTLEEKYLGEGYNSSSSTKNTRLQCFRTRGKIAPKSELSLRFYLLSRAVFTQSTVQALASGDKAAVKALKKSCDLSVLADETFVQKADEKTKSNYIEVLSEAVKKIGPVCRHYSTETEEHIIIAYKRGTTHSFFSGLTDLYHNFGFHATRKYVEPLANGYVIINLCLNSTSRSKEINCSLASKLANEASLLYVLPRTSLTPLFHSSLLTIQEVTYAYVAWKFSYHFIGKFSGQLPVSASVLSALEDSFTEQRVKQSVFEHASLIKELYSDFEKSHNKKDSARVTIPSLDKALLAKITKSVKGELDAKVLSAFLVFNAHVKKTNFFKKSKVALSFRLDPTFLSTVVYPLTPYAIIFVVGSEFRGFHVRFEDVARGGIRIVRSANIEAFSKNSRTLFDENYGLASTQQRKNKDIPEGGSKGTILLALDHQDKAHVAFHKYADAVLDILLPNDEIIDHLGHPEILFFGPDEGTADLMNWASRHASVRGASFWKAFTTGKAPEKGGIPHDTYGMTTRSIHQYVLGILHHYNINEKDCFKFQTGGPDGDLGSNEIKISYDKTRAIVDGSGVLYDEEGLNRDELARLANARLMGGHFNKSLLSSKGFFVSISDVDVKLPNGDIVESGMQFRNLFHLNPLSSADLFVPCGGRPEAVNATNVEDLFFKKENGEISHPRFKYIVEGANLFFSQEARLFLEKQGVVIVKDSSANKGGVTSSSLEVLVALALKDDEFQDIMTVKKGADGVVAVPEFYQQYVLDVQRIIEENARREFECLWKSYTKDSVLLTDASDSLSKKIIEMTNVIRNSDLMETRPSMYAKVLAEAIPKTLLSKISLETVNERVPKAYLRSMFASTLASRFIYDAGINPDPFAFFQFVDKFMSS